MQSFACNSRVGIIKKLKTIYHYLKIPIQYNVGFINGIWKKVV